MRKFLPVTISFLCVSLCLQAQKNYMQVQEYRKDEELKFPLFSCKTDTLTAQKINTTLQLGELQLIKGHEQNNLFEQVEKVEGFYGSKVNLDYTIAANNDRVISIILNEAASGITMHYWENFYNFNAKNGEEFDLANIFTTSGLKTFTAIVLQKRLRAFQVAKNKGNVQQDFYDDNQRCFTELEHTWFYISGDSLYIDAYDGLRKGDQSADIELTYAFSFSRIEPFLNAYGKAVFTPGSDVDSFHSYHHPQLMTGTINNKYPILFLMRNEGDEDVTAIYAYEKNGIGITLQGTLKENKLELTERGNKEQDRAVINAIVTRNEITGSWTDKQKNHTYSFHVKK